MTASIGLVRLQDSKLVYRVLIAENWIDTEKDPPAATEAAFLRRYQDTTGVSVFVEPHFCFVGVRPEIIRGIAALRVSDVRTLSNPITRECLDVLQDKPTHAFIQNLPFHREHEKEANDMSIEIASKTFLLSEQELAQAAQQAMQMTTKKRRIASLIAWLARRQ